ncbi:hypothetical protein [Fowlpox virus]|nr:hypothetical protein [Fowlpox virus]
MFKNYKYQPLKDNDYEEDEILIPGLEDDDFNIPQDETINNKISFEKQMFDIVKKDHNNNYKNLMILLTRYNNTNNLTELLYNIISSKCNKKYTFDINSFDKIFGIYSNLHEFTYIKKVKILYEDDFLKIIFIRDNISLEIDVKEDTEGKLMDIDYKIEFKDAIKLKIHNIEILIRSKLIYIKNKIFILSDNTKIVSNENKFLLEIRNIKN